MTDKELIKSTALLQCYKYIDRSYDTLNKLLEGVFDNVGGANLPNDTMRQFNRIERLEERKVLLMNIKILINETLDKLNPKERRILHNKYIKLQDFDVMAKEMHVSMRTILRQYEKGLISFHRQLNLAGYTNEVLSKRFSTEIIYDLAIFEVEKIITGNLSRQKKEVLKWNMH